MTSWQRHQHHMIFIFASALAGAATIPARAEASDFIESIGDPGLNYFSLGLLIFVILLVFYGLVAIHDIPARIAESRHHPHADAIHAAGWVSLFTLHVLWPFLWIWAMAYKPDRGWGFSTAEATPQSANKLNELEQRLAAVEGKLKSKAKGPRIATEDKGQWKSYSS
jgi:hypothetical protein